jgi:uncharacterized membrane protein SirB2
VNPLGIEALRSVLGPLDTLLTMGYFGVLFASASSLVIRFRRSRGKERQQIKWLACAASVVRTWFLTNGWVVAAVSPFSGVKESGLVDGLLLAAVPIAVGIAVLRYRLYDHRAHHQPRARLRGTHRSVGVGLREERGLLAVRLACFDRPGVHPEVVACNLSIAAQLSREREAREEGRFPLFPLSSKRFRERPQEEMEELRLARERERADRHRAVMYTNLGSGVVAHKDGALELTWRAGEGVGQVCALPRCTAPATTS